MKKALQLLLAFLLMVTTVFTAVPVSADPYENGENGDPIELTSTLQPWKTLRTNEGTYFPGELFNFALHRIAIPAVTDENDEAYPFVGTSLTDGHAIGTTFPAAPPTEAVGLPAVPVTDGELDIPESGEIGSWRILGDVNIAASIPTLVYPDLDGSVYAEGRSDDMLAGLTWTHAGVYAFRLREVTPIPNPRVVTEGTSITETTHFDTREFEVHVRIGIDAEGDFVVEEVAVFIVDEDGDRTSKVNVGDRWGLNFTNNFIREINNIPGEPVPCPPTIEDPNNPGEQIPNPDYPDCDIPPIYPPCPENHPDYPDCEPIIVIPNERGLRMSKTVYGQGSSNDHVFQFTGELELPAVLAGARPTEFVAFIYSNDTRIAENNSVTFAWDADTETFRASFNLQGGQELRLPALPVGTTFEFVETNRLHYTGTTIFTWLGTHFIPEREFGTNDAPPFSTGRHLVTDYATHSAFLNELNQPPLTGIITGNMPLILASLVGLGFVGMVVLNKKRRAYE